jgi:hypothetical protein
MSFSVMRRMAGLVLALVWSGARLAQPLQPGCPHHTVVEAAAPDAAGATAHAHHGLPPASALATAGAQPAPDQAPVSDQPCECAAHCCAASAVAIAVAPTSVVVATVTLAAAPLAARPSPAPTNGAQRRQPPSTAPPATSAV